MSMMALDGIMSVEQDNDLVLVKPPLPVTA
jgi:hypothetical protein